MQQVAFGTVILAVLTSTATAAHADPLSQIIVATLLPGITGTAAAIASSLVTLGLGVGVTFIPSRGDDQ